MSEHLEWKDKGRKVLADYRVFRVEQVDRISPEGEEAAFYILRVPDWVNIVPVVRNEAGAECFVMVHQFRQGSAELSMEFPGGVVDEGESPDIAAPRELLEETGYRAGRIFHAGKIRPNPAIQDNWQHTYIALDLESVSEKDLDEHEFLDHELVPVAEVEREMGRGRYAHAMMMIALEWYRRWKEESR